MKTRQFIKNLIVILAIVIVQTSVFPAIFNSQEIPNVMLMFVIAWTILTGFPFVFIWVTVAGILLDLLSFSVLGTNVIALIILAYAASFFSRRFLMEEKGLGIATIALIVLIATLAYRVITLFLAGIDLNSIMAIKFNWFYPIGWEIFYNIIVFFICFYIVKKIYYSAIKGVQLSLLNIRK